MDVKRLMTVDLATRDLVGRRERINTSAMFGTLIVATGVCLISYGLVLGRWRVERQRIDRDAWAMVLRAGHNLTTRGAITRDVLADLRRRLNERFADRPHVIRAVLPYRSCKDRIQTFTFGGQTADLTGRTIHFDGSGPDLYLSGQEIAAPGRGFTSGDDEGLILTPGALSTLGLEQPPPIPFRVSVEVGVTKREVEVVGIFTKNLPDRYDFVITEGFERRLMRGDPRLPYVISGPLPRQWLEGEGAIAWDKPDSWRTLSSPDDDRIESVEMHDDGLRIQAATRIDPSTGGVASTLAESTWQQLLQGWESALRTRTGVGSADFLRFHADGREKADVDVACDLVNVYVREASALRPAADICDEVINFAGQPTVNRDVVHRLEKIDERLQDSMNTVNVQQGVIVVLSAFCLVVLQVFRAGGKRNEVGMLRAMGMKRRQVVQFIAWQACLLAIVGAGVGVALGYLVALTLSYSAYGDPAETLTGVAVPWSLLTAIGGGSVGITMLAGFAAAWPWFVHDPARLMR